MQIDKILVIGDSITRGALYDVSAERYTYCKKRYTELIRERIKPELVESGRVGAPIDYAVKKLPVLLEKEKPDIVLIAFGGNDSDFRWDEIASAPENEHKPATELGDFKANLRYCCELIKLCGAQPILMNLPPIDAVRYFKWFTGGDSAKGEAILGWLGEVGRIFWWHERYSDAVLRLSRETGIPMIDARGEFMELYDYRELISIDGIHPNEKGHKAIADAIELFIRQMGRQDILAFDM